MKTYGRIDQDEARQPVLSHDTPRHTPDRHGVTAHGIRVEAHTLLWTVLSHYTHRHT